MTTEIRNIENNSISLNKLARRRIRTVKTNQHGLIKDTRTGAIINTNINELNTIKDRLKHSKDINSLNSALNAANKDIDELKMLVKSLLDSRK